MPSMLESSERRLQTSVVLATYNGAKYLRPLLHSLAHQSQPPCEIIVTDDNSTDDTISIVSEFSKQTTIPVRLLRNDPALGFAENFLQGAAHAKGDLVAFCDQDDIWAARKIATCADAFDDSSVLLVAHTARLIDSEGEVIGQFPQKIYRNMLCPPRSIDPWQVFLGFSLTFRRGLLAAVPPNLRGIDFVSGSTRLAHDRWIVFLANMLGRIRLMREPLVDYRQHGGNLFGAYPHFGRTSKSSTIASAARYRQSSCEFRALVSGIPQEVAEKFPLFDRALCERFWDTSIRQQEARQRVYQASSSFSALIHAVQNLFAGVYNNAHDGRFRWQSAVKDLGYPLMAKQ